MSARTVSVRTVSIDVDVDLDKFTSDDLIRELRARQIRFVPDPGEDDIAAIYRMVAEGRGEDALDMMRKIFPKLELLPGCDAIRLHQSILNFTARA